MKDGLARKVSMSRTFRHLREAYQLDRKAVLDIGCSEGYYLEHFGEGSVGLTLIDEHIAAAAAKGLTVVKANVEQPLNLDRAFEVLWANNLFEHLNAPHIFLMRMRDMVVPNGMLILGVPIIPAVPGLTRLKKFRGAYAASHVNYFTRRTLIDTVRAAGWQVHEARLFYFKHAWFDRLFSLVIPHVYVVAAVDPDFAYAEKRLKSLREYDTANSVVE